ncbi:DUF5320 domain-containing protein [Patescibacteria group bacterium]|nr:DUF5320 domain-containing protein [Patescibacteria group bacterium]
MPNFNGMGPDGQGPQTGLGLGQCRSNQGPQNQATRPPLCPRRGCGQGMGRGAGRRNRFSDNY